MRSRLVSLVATALLALGLTSFGPSTATAGTADYHYTCSSPGVSSWTMPAGTPLRDCANGYVEVRLNGSLVEVIPVNAEGARLEERVWTKSDIACVVAVLGAVTSVLTAGGTAGWVSAGLSVAGVPLCRS
ncbi:MAG TPA: hypothetical protein VKZ83_11750 [Phototrophicaceae bacterium]|nr:hypothetical protein [Phototrophicaceae bacterium]